MSFIPNWSQPIRISKLHRSAIRQFEKDVFEFLIADQSIELISREHPKISLLERDIRKALAWVIPPKLTPTGRISKAKHRKAEYPPFEGDDHVFSFGKHRCQTLHWALFNDRIWVLWTIRNIKEVKEYIQQLLLDSPNFIDSCLKMEAKSIYFQEPNELQKIDPSDSNCSIFNFYTQSMNIG